MSIALLAAALAALLLSWAVMVFNRLIRRRNQVRTAWADVDVQLMRRHDLVPALARAVSAYADHERGTLEAVTALRDRAHGLHEPAALAAIELDLEVRNLNRQTQRNGTEQLRVGLRFAALPRTADTRIQRYIFKTERELNAKARGGI